MDADQIPAQDVAGDVGEPTAASEPDASQAAPAPADGAPAASSDYGSLVDRYKSAGLDLSAMDPVALARAHGIAQKVGSDGTYYTQEQLPQVFQDGIKRLAATPEGRQWIQSHLGDQSAPASSAGVADSDDPYETRFTNLEKQMNQLVQVGQQLMGQQQSFGRERQAEQRIKELTDHFAKAISNVPGASESALLEDLFWNTIGSGGFPQELMNPAGVQSWVQARLSADQKARSGRRKSRTPTPQSGGGAAIGTKDVRDMSPDDLQKFLEGSLPG